MPVRLINSSVGGTPIEAWIAPEAQASVPELNAGGNANTLDEATMKADTRSRCSLETETEQAKKDGEAAAASPSRSAGICARWFCSTARSR
ncbi:MAG: hypothetical protein U0996_25415 [Planctomycetaceae bacterium]